MLKNNKAMKKTNSILIAVFLTAIIILPRQSNAQTPEKMKYQAVARDNAGNVLSNQLISFQISILQGSSVGTSVYSETHSVSSNDFGLANLNIGNGTIVSGDFSTIDWSTDQYFLQVEMDETGGSSYQLMGTSQLLSVPYALHAKTADSAINGSHNISDTDGDTKIQVEKNPNEDIIRFDMAGTEFFKMDNGRLEVLNTGHSVYIGKGAGANDDLSDNYNVAIGDSALFNNGIGASQLDANFNTALGSKSLYSNTDGFQNTASGYAALYSNTTGSWNTAYGYGALYFNEVSGNYASGYKSLYHNIGGFYNTATGNLALVSNTNGNYNTATGNYALRSNVTGNENTAIGYEALKNNTQSKNTATGYQALYSNTNGVGNTAYGHQSLYSNTTGNNNAASGSAALYSNINGHWNTAMGTSALYDNETGNDNTAMGWAALTNNIDGDENTATGRAALFNNTSGDFNTANGKSALYYSTTGNHNTATGYKALVNNTHGSFNTAIGSDALNSNTYGEYNTAVGDLSLSDNVSGTFRTGLGAYANSTGTNYTNNTGLGAGAYCSASDQVRIGNISVSSIGGYANWSNLSDERFKNNIEENVEGLLFIEKLRPVTYNMDLYAIDNFFAEHYNVRDSSNYDGKYDKGQIRYTGFIAQEVEEAARELGYDFSGVDKPKNENDFYGLRYAEFVVPLVKGMQEQQELIEQQTALIEELKMRIENLENN